MFPVQCTLASYSLGQHLDPKTTYEPFPDNTLGRSRAGPHMPAKSFWASLLRRALPSNDGQPRPFGGWFVPSSTNLGELDVVDDFLLHGFVEIVRIIDTCEARFPICDGAGTKEGPQFQLHMPECPNLSVPSDVRNLPKTNENEEEEQSSFATVLSYTAN